MSYEEEDELDEDPDEADMDDSEEDDDDDILIYCPQCRAEIFALAERCPKCGHLILDDDRREAVNKQPMPRALKIVAVVVLIAVVVLGMVAFIATRMR